VTPRSAQAVVDEPSTQAPFRRDTNELLLPVTDPRPDSSSSAVDGQDTAAGISSRPLTTTVSIVGIKARRPGGPVFRPRRRPNEFFAALHRWEGYVLSVSNRTFLARLVDLSGRLPDEDAEFYLDDVSESDKSLVVPGAVFYWSVGYRISLTRQRSKASLLRFRRLPAWTQSEIEDARRIAEESMKRFR
jgi:hypothetical protein